jgi:hypothetical protein
VLRHPQPRRDRRLCGREERRGDVETSSEKKICSDELSGTKLGESVYL